MFDVYDLLLGGLTPMTVAAAALGVGWAATHRPSAAWSLGVILGYAAGATALDARGAGLGLALQRLAQPSVAHQWAPMVSLIAVVPSIVAGLLGKRRRMSWLLAAAICAAGPLWLLWGGKYLPSRQLRDAGFAGVWGAAEAVAILAGVAAALWVAWYLWEAVEPNEGPRVRSLLAVIAIVGAAAAAGLTRSFVYAQLFGVLAASLGGCAVVSWFLPEKSGPEGAAGPVIMLAGSLLLLAACYSQLRPLQAIGLGASIIAAAGWLPGLSRLRGAAQVGVRVIVCLVPLLLVLGQAAADFAETQRRQQKAAESNPYLNL